MTTLQGLIFAAIFAMAMVWNYRREWIPRGYKRFFHFCHLALFTVLAVTIIRQAPDDDDAATPSSAAAAQAVPNPGREAAFDLHRAQQWPQAIAAYDAVVKAEGEDAEILYWRGMAHWKSAQFDQAYRDFRRVIDLDPTHLDALRNADRLLARQKKWDEVITMWNWYISRQPPNADAYFERGGAYFQKGDMAAAAADAKKACELGKPQGCRMAERLKGQ